ncbi:wax ester/triacylglycerol synthase family O-acyltransferase [Candidatus Binatia bacterium]|nr:wax ester/triacylglycerol synthase family O-acyltransferase [Candidatus Binatia bacterium]
MAATDRIARQIRGTSRMFPTDALFWYAEEAAPAFRPLVAALMMLDRPPDPDRLRATLQRWTIVVPRLQQRVVEMPLSLGLPEWEDDPYFDLDYHAREVVLPEPATDRHLLDFCGAVFATPLDHLRPLWEAYLIEGLEGNRAACFFKIHHAVIDGVGSVAAIEALTQAHRAEPVRVPRCAPRRPPRPASTRLLRLGRDLVGNAAAGAGAAAGVALRAMTHPVEVADQAVRVARGLRGMAADLMSPGIHDPLADAATGVGRRLDALTLPLPRLRRIKAALGITLNDLVLVAVSGAVGRYHDRRRVHVDTLNCLVPMNLRQDSERDALGNRVGMLNIPLPVGERDPMRRIEAICRRTQAAKSDRRGAALPFLVQALAMAPSAVYRLFVSAITAKLNLICTNVPGPAQVRYSAGAKIEAVYPFAPVVVGVPLSIALMSYGDDYGIGIASDPAAIPDPTRLHEHLNAEIDALERCTAPRLHAAPAATKRRPRRAAP